MSNDFVLILGCGYTGRRVLRRLLERGVPARGTRRKDVDFTAPGAADRLRQLLVPGCIVLHSIPSLANGADQTLVRDLRDMPGRVVYLSTTGVYGPAREVDETTAPAPATPRELARVATEDAVRRGPWSTLILRPAAIYGPGRGAHIAVAEGRYTLRGDGSNYISRIHVEDLAAIVEAALFSPITGAFPVADDQPATSRQIGEFCAELLGVPPPESASIESIPETRRSDRRVNGSAIRRLLDVRLQYPSYREGIPASIRNEGD